VHSDIETVASEGCLSAHNSAVQPSSPAALLPRTRLVRVVSGDAEGTKEEGEFDEDAEGDDMMG